jgi:antirestriction protein ArdC
MENKTDTPKTTVREKYNAVVKNFISKLENNDIEPWTKSWSTDAGLPKNFESNNHYQGMNILTLLDKGFKDSRWLTFNQIKKLGGSVIQGEKSSPVFFLKPLEKEEINKETQEIETKKYFIMKSYNVFNIEQTKGIEYKPESKVDNANSDIQTFIDSFEIDVYPGAPAYSPKDDCIFMPSLADFDSNQNEYYSTFFHELTHSTGHKDRLDRFEQNTTFGDGKYAYEELIAELGSAFLSLEHTIHPNSKKQAAYLKSWIVALKEKPQILYSASSQASRSTNYLLEQYKLKQELKVQQGVDYNINLTKIISKENQPSSNNNNNPSPLAS